MFEFSTSEVGLVKYRYDEQLAVIVAFLVIRHSGTANKARLEESEKISVLLVSVVAKAEECRLHAVSRKSPVK